MLFVFPVSDIYPSARGKNKMETFQALARTSTRSKSWLGIRWLGRTHWWIWHGGTCASSCSVCDSDFYFEIDQSSPSSSLSSTSLNFINMSFWIIGAFMTERWSLPLTRLDKNLIPFEQASSQVLLYLCLTDDLPRPWPNGQVRMKSFFPGNTIYLSMMTW